MLFSTSLAEAQMQPSISFPRNQPRQQPKIVAVIPGDPPADQTPPQSYTAAISITAPLPKVGNG